MRFLLIFRINTEGNPCTYQPRAIYYTTIAHREETPGSTTNIRIGSIKWLKKWIEFIRKLGGQTARQRQITDLLGNEDRLTEQERKLLHALATAGKDGLQAQENERKRATQERIKGKKRRREHNHRPFLAARLLIEAGPVDTEAGELCYKKDMSLQRLKPIKYDLDTCPNPDA